MEDKWQELRQLEAQRSDLITKLAKIDEKKEMVSEEVYGKVKNEYEEKLNNIDIQMGKHMDLIKEELTNINDQELKLLSDEKEINMQIEEIELRYSIGEYDEESYMSLSDEKKDARSKARDNLENLKKRKKWLEDFIDVKDIEETIAPEPPTETPAQKPEEAPPEPVVAEKEPENVDTDIQIEEHILEEKLPEEETKLDELIVEEEAVKQEVVEELKSEEESAAQPVKEKEKNAPCPKCGHSNALDSWYCEKCGAEILDSPPAS
jgi:hypothetical protein